MSRACRSPTTPGEGRSRASRHRRLAASAASSCSSSASRRAGVRRSASPRCASGSSPTATHRTSIAPTRCATSTPGMTRSASKRARTCTSRPRIAYACGERGNATMNIELSSLEARVIGCLIEKQITTPDQYPLSLNALVNACNQKSNRDPVMEVDEVTIQGTVDQLARKHFVVEKSGFGSRVPKFQHRFCNTEYGTLKLTAQELAIVCELLLRGPQTPGELRTRASRMAAFSEVGQAEAALERLRTREDGPFVVRLPREPGRRDSRYAHLFSGAVAVPASAEPQTVALSSAGAETSARLDRLEERVQRLREELEDLKRRLPS